MKPWVKVAIGVATVGVTATIFYYGGKWLIKKLKKPANKISKTDADAAAKKIEESKTQRLTPEGGEEIKKLQELLTSNGYENVGGVAILISEKKKISEKQPNTNFQVEKK